MEFVVAIPARYGASRLPGKPLRLLAGEPLVVHVVRRAQAAGAAEVVVATDDPRIADAVSAHDVRVCMTSPAHASGTDRLAECAATLGWNAERIVVNLQGDEPFAPPDGIRAVAEALAESTCGMATLATPIEDATALWDPNTVKLVRRADGRALYFSRAPIPWDRERFAHDRLQLAHRGPWLRHIGIYAYRVAFLQRFARLAPGQLEALEALEQLRVLEAGEDIAVALAPSAFPPGVDTPEDLEQAELRMMNNLK